MEPIVFTSQLQRQDMFRLGVRTGLLNSLSLTAMAAGPVLMLAGYLAGGTMVRSFGATLIILDVVIPAGVVIVASYNAYRPTAAEQFDPATWEFDDEGVRVHTGDQQSFAAWEDFFGWRSTGGFYLLHTSRRHYVVLRENDVPGPRRADFEALLSANTRTLG